MQELIFYKTLDNGIRLVHRQVGGTKVAHCAIMFDVGSRDELNDEIGLAHLWEHMAFKGTNKRSAYQVLTYLDSLGGELNAFTTKEKLCFHASILNVHLEKAIDVLCDISFNSTFPDKELIKEKKVILEEISMYHDTPDDAIQDEFEVQLFENHPMGNNILGTLESIPTFERDNFLKFIERNVSTDRIVFATTGDFSSEQAFSIIEKKIGGMPRKESKLKRNPVNVIKIQHIKVDKPIQQAHCILGGRALSLQHPDKYKLMLLNNILGGPASNSLLYLSLREKYGFVYSVESNYHAFTDTGAFQVYFATEKKQLNKCIDLISKELLKLDDLLSKKSKLEAYKQQIKGQLAVSEENNQAYLLMMARSILDMDKVENLDHVFDEIDNTNSEQLIELRKQFLDPGNLSSLIYSPSN
ncbi:MAG: insulinase family protein [Opitutaceae bacterium]|nr:insulinase family protein [Cytophagales bacterium]